MPYSLVSCLWNLPSAPQGPGGVDGKGQPNTIPWATETIGMEALGHPGEPVVFSGQCCPVPGLSGTNSLGVRGLWLSKVAQSGSGYVVLLPPWYQSPDIPTSKGLCPASPQGHTHPHLGPWSGTPAGANYCSASGCLKSMGLACQRTQSLPWRLPLTVMVQGQSPPTGDLLPGMRVDTCLPVSTSQWSAVPH